MHSWSELKDDRDVTYLLTVDGERRASVWFLGGHVERPDAWHITFRPSDKLSSTQFSFETSDEAKRYAEEVCGVVST